MYAYGEIKGGSVDILSRYYVQKVEDFVQGREIDTSERIILIIDTDTIKSDANINKMFYDAVVQTKRRLKYHLIKRLNQTKGIYLFVVIMMVVMYFEQRMSNKPVNKVPVKKEMPRRTPVEETSRIAIPEPIMEVKPVREEPKSPRPNTFEEEDKKMEEIKKRIQQLKPKQDK